MTQTVMLDSWAWIAYLQSDPRAKPVRELIEGTTDIIASAMNVAEVHTYLLRHKGERFFSLIRDRAHIISVDEELAHAAAQLKVTHNLGMADAIILATAQSQKVRLVTGDPDFKGMKDVVYLGA